MKKLITALLLLALFTASTSSVFAGAGEMRQVQERLQSSECACQEEEGRPLSLQQNRFGPFERFPESRGRMWRAEKSQRPQECPLGNERPMRSGTCRWQSQ